MNHTLIFCFGLLLGGVIGLICAALLFSRHSEED
jgi:hypothetical protein